MAWDDNLTGTHYDIAAYPGPLLRIQAGPGTGKTFAMMRRVARLLESGAAPDRILAVSFTRTAAKDLVDKLSQLGSPGATAVVARTVHSLCFSLLMRHKALVPLARTPRPLLDHELDARICDLASAFGGRRSVRRLLKAFDAYWATLQSQIPGWPQDPIERTFHSSLVSWLQFHEGMLIGELIPLAIDFVSTNPNAMLEGYEHVLVDEYQDLNKADQTIVDLLGQNASITVIGDEDQSIYQFRYANPAGISQFGITHQGTHDESLSECRRCGPNVVSLATDLISRNPTQRQPLLTSAQNIPASDVYIVQHDTFGDQEAAVAAYIDWYLDNTAGVRPGEVLVLSPRRTLGYDMRDRLNQIARAAGKAWSAQSFFFEQALDSDDTKEAFTLLSLIANPDDKVAYRTWLGLGGGDSRARPYARLRTVAEAMNQSPRTVLAQVAAGNLKIPYTAELVARHNALNARLTATVGIEGQALIDRLFPTGNPALAELRAVAQAALSDGEAPEDLRRRMSELITQPELPGEQDDVIRIMSLHKSKGLTAKLVIVLACVEGAIPFLDTRATPAEQRESLQEQRRLFYVAITRATATLVLSSVARTTVATARQLNLQVVNRRRYGAELQTSRFVAELGAGRPQTLTGAAWRAAVPF